MADKEKRLSKILSRIRMKGKLKLVGSLEEAHLILVEDRNDRKKTMLIGKDSYTGMMERGYTFQEQTIYYLVSTNPRDRWNVDKHLLSNSFGFMGNMY